MKRIISIVVFAVLIIAIKTSFSFASSSTTYFYSEGIKIKE